MKSFLRFFNPLLVVLGVQAFLIQIPLTGRARLVQVSLFVSIDVILAGACWFHYLGRERDH